MHTWAAILPLAETAALAPYRLAAIDAMALQGELWLRGTGEIPRTVPWREIFELREGGALHHPGHLLSAGRLPAGTWQKLAMLLGVARPPVLREGMPPVRAVVRLVPEAHAHPVALLATTAERWLAFATQAPVVRLRALHFAQTETGRVFIKGEPLPSIPGDYFSLRGHIATPAGHTWEPALSETTLASALSLAAGETAVWLADGPWLRIPARAWQPASRAAVRLLAQSHRDEY